MAELNVTERIQHAKFNSFHLKLAFVGFVLIMFEGYDVAINGTITPPLMAEWKLPPVEAGAIGSAGLLGMLFGAIIFGALADRLGRKRIVLVTVLLYTVFTALCGFAQEPAVFTVFRVIAGLGLGGVMPNVIALLTDFSPKRLTATIVTVVLVGFSVGGLLAPVLGIAAIPVMGWRVCLWIAAVPLPFLPFMFRSIPQSVGILLKQGDRDGIFKVLSVIAPGQQVDRNSEFVTASEKPAKLPITDLFNNRRALSTTMFWIAIFAHLLLAYGILNWLPKLMMGNGLNLTSSLTFSVVFQVGGIIGTLVAGGTANRLGAKKLVISLFLTGAVVMAVTGISTNSLVTYLLVGVAGAVVTGVQNLIQVYIAQYYPPFVRSTALGTATGVGRLGGIMGPILGGLLLSLSLSNQAIFFVFAVPGLISASAMALVRENKSHQHQLDEAEILQQAASKAVA